MEFDEIGQRDLRRTVLIKSIHFFYGFSVNCSIKTGYTFKQHFLKLDSRHTCIIKQFTATFYPSVYE